MQYIIGSWYRKDELAKRSCLFHAMGNVGSMVSGYLMAASHNLDGVHVSTDLSKYRYKMFLTNLSIILTGLPRLAMALYHQYYHLLTHRYFWFLFLP